jgi:hypothetical protein
MSQIAKASRDDIASDAMKGCGVNRAGLYGALGAPRMKARWKLGAALMQQKGDSLSALAWR